MKFIDRLETHGIFDATLVKLISGFHRTEKRDSGVRLCACSWSMLCKLWRMTSTPKVLLQLSNSPSPRQHCHVIIGSLKSGQFAKQQLISQARQQIKIEVCFYCLLSKLCSNTVYCVQYATQLITLVCKGQRSKRIMQPALSTWFCHCVFFRDVLKWLLSAIMKSTEPGDSIEAARERDEQMRSISFLFLYCLFSTPVQQKVSTAT